jgi:hypothetical protein
MPKTPWPIGPLLRWVKKKLGILTLELEVKALKAQLQFHREFVTASIAELKEHTRVDADVGFRGNNTIILTGVYKRQAFVRFYDVGDAEFISLVEQLKHMKKYALIRHVDALPNFRGVFKL